MATYTHTSFPEIAGMVLSLAQMIFYLAAFDKYKDRLEQMAVDLKDRSDIEAGYYDEFRSQDPDFYQYYQDLPDYGPCESHIRRTKGAAFRQLGNTLREVKRGVRGFTPLANVTMVNHAANQHGTTFEPAVARAVTYNQEQVRVNEHVLHRWRAIVSAPIGVEASTSAYASGIIADSFKNLRGAGQGFNSAGVSFGNFLYGAFN